jgi:hypothetical protein
MTAPQFTAWAEATFGKYMHAMKLEVEEWLKPKDGYFIAAMREVVLRDHPSTYGKPPGVHELDGWKIEAYAGGHALEAIEKARSGTKLVAAEVVENVTEAQAAENARKLRERMGPPDA